MPTKKAARSKKTTTRATASRKPVAKKKLATRAAKKTAPKAKPKTASKAAGNDKYSQSGAPWWKRFI